MNPVVVGVYGLPGSGKSFILKQLRQQLSHRDFLFFEGSEVISGLVPGGLEAFRGLSDREKSEWRKRAIADILAACRRCGTSAVVTGHYMFWSEGDEMGQPVYTENDMQTYSHIVYLDVPVKTVAEQSRNDQRRLRQNFSEQHLDKWQQHEISELRRLCQQHGILFSRLHRGPVRLHEVVKLIQFSHNAVSVPNTARVNARVDEVLLDHSNLRDMFIIDADKTLAAVDTGNMFWNTLSQSNPGQNRCPTLRQLFGGPLGYSETAFLQATLQYEEAVDEEMFETICSSVARQVTMHPEFIALLGAFKAQNHIQALIVTCGIRRIWEKVLELTGLSKHVNVIGGGRISDGIVVTAETKAEIATYLKKVKGLHVWAIGDSILDLPMLEAADEAIVVTGEAPNRSRSMDAALAEAIEERGLRVREALLPRNAAPRLGKSVLTVVDLSSSGFIAALLRPGNESSVSDICTSQRTEKSAKWASGLTVLEATDRNSAKLLMSSMRDASVVGVALRKAHRKVGRYLALEFLSELLGLEEYPMDHVQGHKTEGHRLADESKTTVVALMRGGEEMAFGVNDVFPSAMFLHADSPNDVKGHHVRARSTLILVDSVVNNGTTVERFVQRIRQESSSIRIIVVAGVVQAQSLVEGHPFARLLALENISLVALRRSENKFTGTKTTDTGNRLFNTTHLA